MRLHQVIVWSNHTTNSFAKSLGLARAECLYQIKRGNYGISLRMANLIVSRFPQISKLWLLTGDGEMFVDDGLGSCVVPFYDEDVCSSAAAVGELKPMSDIILPRIGRRCDFAMRDDAASGNDTTAIVLLRRCVGELHRPGEYLLLENGRGRLLEVGEQTLAQPDPDAETIPYAGDDNIICEVVGRISLKL